jgi:hypothetical protein
MDVQDLVLSDPCLAASKIPLRRKLSSSASLLDKEGIIGGPGKTTAAKRDREKSRQQKQRDKEARRVQRKANKPDRPAQEGEDPDLAGLQWGPQAPLY